MAYVYIYNHILQQFASMRWDWKEWTIFTPKISKMLHMKKHFWNSEVPEIVRYFFGRGVYFIKVLVYNFKKKFSL